MIYKLKSFVLIFLILLLSGCRLPDLVIMVGGGDSSSSTPKYLAYNGNQTLYRLNVNTTNSKAYSLEAVDLVSGNSQIVAGTQNQLFSDGTGTAAGFFSPKAMTYFDGKIYVADSCTVRRVDPINWQVVTIAGSYNQCTTDTDGTGTGTARFNQVNGLVGYSGELYVATTYKIRKLNLTTFAVTTLAGSTTGYTDAVGVSAKFANLGPLTIIGNNIYAADLNNHRIRQFNISTGAVTTLAGSGATTNLDGVGTAATFYMYDSNLQITSDGDKFLFLSSPSYSKIRKINVQTADVSSIFNNLTTTYSFDFDGLFSGGSQPARIYGPSGLQFTPYGLAVSNDWAIRLIN